VLVAAGGSAQNYNIAYVSGDFTIVPSNQLLVRVADLSTAYGTAPSYTIDSAQYWNGSNAVNLVGITSNGSNNFTIRVFFHFILCYW